MIFGYNDKLEALHTEKGEKNSMPNSHISPIQFDWKLCWFTDRSYESDTFYEHIGHKWLTTDQFKSSLANLCFSIAIKLDEHSQIPALNFGSLLKIIYLMETADWFVAAKIVDDFFLIVNNSLLILYDYLTQTNI